MDKFFTLSQTEKSVFQVEDVTNASGWSQEEEKSVKETKKVSAPGRERMETRLAFSVGALY